MSLLIIIVLVIAVIILLVMYLISNVRYKELEDDFYNLAKDGFRDSNKIIMIEYYIREYKEQNKNAFTVLRDISNLIYDDYKIKK